ncbi:hypothetical protein LUZ60_000833 [Juncus effusus]|nr:hypothetical protein LUZ60_000833 [Juncus effusus]
MLDGLFGSKFSNKCKHSVKYIRARLDPIRKKKEAVVWYLKRDVAELISHGHDLNAFSRMETLIMEMNQESCYNMIEQYCEDILNQLKVIEKQRECPDEAKEAISTLIFAAARFPDLRELREIRQIFTEKFGGHMEPFVNSEFMKNTQEKTFSDERKIRVMHNIATEFSIGFDSESFKWKLANPAQAKYDEPKKPESRTEQKDLRTKPKELQNEPKELRSKASWAKPKDLQAEPKELPYKPNKVTAEPKELRAEPKELRYKLKELSPEQKELRYKPKELPYKPKELRAEPKVIWDEPKELRYKPKEEPKVIWDEPKESRSKQREYRAQPKDIHVIPKKTEKIPTTDHALNDTPKKNHYREETTKESPYSFHSEKHNNIGSVLKDNGSDFTRPDPKGKTSKMIPPPYTKPNTPRVGKYTEEESFDSDPYLADKQYIKPSKEDRPIRVEKQTNLAPPYVESNNEKPKPVSVRSKIPKPQIIPETNNNESALYDEELLARAESKNRKHRHYDERKYENGVNYEKEFDKSLGRTSSSKSRQRGYDEVDEEDNSIDYGNLLRGPSRGHSRRHKHKERDDEERVMDKLLMHYSKKGIEQPVKERSEPGKERSSRGTSAVDQVYHGPGRTVSLPTDPVREEESARVPVRAVSLQPDPLVNGARVHPNLPDFDELAARIQALRKA